MSVTSALASALTGIHATSRQAEAISSNVANATTPGYGHRSVSLSAMEVGGTGQGVRVRGIQRDIDQFLINDRRVAQSAASDRETRSSFLKRLEDIFGTPESTGSLVGRVNALDATLLEAASRPESEARLGAAVNAARDLALGLNQASDAIQAERAKADTQIAAAVDLLNGSLRQVRELNTQIRGFSGAGRDVSALLDQRQQIIDRISDLVPVREIARDHDQVALITTGGAVLLDGVESEFGFTAVHTIVPEMTVQSGGLSGLTLNDRPMATEGQASLIQGGELAALFAVRDTLAVEGQARLDALARDLAERFADPGIDPTLSPGNPGLFTDGGAAFLPADEVGLSARLSVNALADPAQGGLVSRLRDGLESLSVGPSGNAAVLVSLTEALGASRPTSSATLPAASRGLPGLAAEILSLTSTARLSAESETAFTAARYAALDEMERAGGVDTDEEMQALLVVEKNYAANAKVLQTVDEMINALLGL
ncbi:flagellar hook-associated protein FlgK [Rhodobacter sp. Har01]|uniref:flagellar hook-associated protein FlgK n=1 Tax=Rhodobacter sp. Har01 TaxID=2883999 RepID=UPI001D078F0B|nr:flagellar hook-associated protein FlgK [Rhodobacter sp. Har01]MCB6177986.1 flagellar hook-associated protein FlgK [Rhodobacter sp. Har01]